MVAEVTATGNSLLLQSSDLGREKKQIFNPGSDFFFDVASDGNASCSAGWSERRDPRFGTRYVPAEFLARFAEGCRSRTVNDGGTSAVQR